LLWIVTAGQEKACPQKQVRPTPMKTTSHRLYDVAHDQPDSAPGGMSCGADPIRQRVSSPVSRHTARARASSSLESAVCNMPRCGSAPYG